MLAEMAAFTAAYKTVKGAVQAGRELATVASSISEMVQSKDDLNQRLNKKKNSPFSTKAQTDLEEFFALEQIKQSEKELEELMIYAGRPGLHQDWVKFSAEARKNRKEAAKKAAKKRAEFMEKLGTAIGIFFGVAIGVGGLIGIIWYFKGF